MIYGKKKIIFGVLGLTILLLVGCSNKINTWGNRQYHMATTRWNVLFNAKESFKKGNKTIKKDFIENFDELLPVYFENNIEVRKRAETDMKRVVDKMVKAIELHSITVKPKRKKGKRDSEKYREFRRKKEYNNLIEECYLLLGKGQFYRREYYSTERTFRYIMRTYREMPIYYETAIWYARTLAEQDKLFRALRTLDDAMKDEKFPPELLNMGYTAKTDFLIREGKYKEAIEPLKYLVQHTKKDEGQTRFYYLLAQLYTKQKEYSKARETYRRLLAIHPENKYAFQASLSESLLYETEIDGQDGREGASVKRLRRLIRDGRNKKFLDEAYFTLGKVYDKRNDIENAIKNYKLSLEYNKANEKQKVKTLMALANINFKKKKDYVAALRNYEELLKLVKSDDAEIALRVEGLKKLAKHLGVVTLQDSLQHIARMPQLERERFIKKRLMEERKSNKRKGRKERKKIDNIIKEVDRPIGQWYFYNSLAVAVGAKEFEEKWGQIALTDNWMRERESLSNNKEQKGDKNIKTNKKYKSYLDYVAALPLTPEQMERSNLEKIDAQYNIGLIYEEELADYPKAINAFEKVLSYNSDDKKYILNSNYHLFLLHTLEGDYAGAEVYKTKIVRDFPNDRLTKILKDPAYYSKLEKMAKDAEILYQQAYTAYTKYDFSDAQKKVNEGLEKYNDIVWYDKFLLLDAMLKGYTGTTQEFEEALYLVLREASSKVVKETALAMKNELVAGKIPNKNINENQKQWKIADFKGVAMAEDLSEDIEQETIDVDIPKSYKDLKDEVHYLAIVLPKDMKGNIVEKVNGFNKELFATKNLNVSRRGFGLNTGIILVEPLGKKVEAWDYLQKFIPRQKDILKGVNEVDYKVMIIAASNLTKLTVDKNIDHYLDFYEEHYNSAIVKAQQSSGDTEKAEEIATSLKKVPYVGMYKYNENTSYNFVLILPRKGTDVNYFWTALHQFDKRFNIRKETFGKQRMLIVENIGNEKEAMEYLQKVVNVPYIYGILEKDKIDYRNFIIDSENLKLLKTSKNLDEYMTFFKSQFL